MFTFLDPYRSTIPTSSEMLAETFVKPKIENKQLCPFLRQKREGPLALAVG